MTQLTIQEFMTLTRAEQNVRLAELSDHDRYLARLHEGSDQMTKEQAERFFGNHEDKKTDEE